MNTHTDKYYYSRTDRLAFSVTDLKKKNLEYYTSHIKTYKTIAKTKQYRLGQDLKTGLLYKKD
jgi:hypothetical protein